MLNDGRDAGRTGMTMAGLCRHLWPWCLAILAWAQTANGKAYVVFRYDDFAADMPGFRSSDDLRQRVWEAEQQTDAVFAEYSMPYVVAVIPKATGLYGGVEPADQCVSLREDPEKVAFLKDAVAAGRIEVAQHGCSHVNNSAVGHRSAEFRECGFQQQLKAVQEGREILSECLGHDSVRTFVPPWNSWDRHTARALKENGFQILSADRSYFYEEANGLVLVPFTAQLWELESLLQHEDLQDGHVVVVLYHPPQIARFDGLEHRYYGADRLRRLLQRMSETPEVDVVTLAELAGKQRESLTTARFRNANALWWHRGFWGRLLPDSGSTNAELLVYLSSQEYARMLWKYRFAFLAGVSLVGLAGYGVRRVLRNVARLGGKAGVALWVGAIGLICVSIVFEWEVIARGYHLTFVRAVPGVFALGYLGALVAESFGRVARRAQGGLAAGQ